MSYILDALNKAERERGVKNAPALPAAHDFQAVHGNRLWIVTCALVACTAAAIWFFLPAHITVSRIPGPAGTGAAEGRAAGRADPEPAGTSVPQNAAPIPNPPPEVPAPGKSAPSMGVPVTPGLKPGDVATLSPVPGTAGAGQESSAGKTGVGAGHRNLPPQAVNLPQPNAAEPQALSSSDRAFPQAEPSATAGDEEPKDAPSAPRTVENKAVSLREALDKMTISVLMYAEAKTERRVYINGRKYVEGDYVDGRYLVESITLEGVVLSYEGERALLRSGSK